MSCLLEIYPGTCTVYDACFIVIIRKSLKAQTLERVFPEWPIFEDKWPHFHWRVTTDSEINFVDKVFFVSYFIMALSFFTRSVGLDRNCA